MVVTLDLKALGWALIMIALLVLIIFCIVFVKNFIATIRHTNKILADAERISTIAAERTEQVNESIGDVAESLSGMADVIKGNQSVVAALTSIVNALSSLKNLMTRNKDKE